MKFKLLLLALLFPALSYAQGEQRTARLYYNYDVSSTSYIYCRYVGNGGSPFGSEIPGGGLIETSGSSTTISESVTDANPFAGLAAGDLLIIRIAGTTTVYNRRIVTYTSDSQVVVDAAVDLGTVGVSFTWLRQQCGTGVGDGWVDASGFWKLNFQRVINTINATSIQTQVECQLSGVGAHILSTASSTATGTYSFPVETGVWDSCRMGVKVTGDGGAQSITGSMGYQNASALPDTDTFSIPTSRYALWWAGGIIESTTPYAGGDGGIGPVNDATFLSAAGATSGNVNAQMLPAFPMAVPLYHRNATNVAAVRLMSTVNGGIQPLSLAASESVDFRIGGTAAAGKLIWVNMPSALGVDDIPFSMRVRVKNFGGWAANDIFNFGFGKPATTSTYETETNVVGFRLQKGAGTEADIYTVYREASGTATAADTGLELVADGNQGLGYADFEVRLSGHVGAVVATWLVNGVAVQTTTLTSLASGGYAPQLFYIAGAGAAFDGPVIERIEIGPTSVSY